MKDLICKFDTIIGIEDRSDFSITRYRVYYKNGLSLSVVRGFASYGNEEGLFEIAVFDKDGFIFPDFFDNEVKGYLTDTELIDYIIMVGNYDTNNLKSLV